MENGYRLFASSESNCTILFPLKRGAASVELYDKDALRFLNKN